MWCSAQSPSGRSAPTSPEGRSNWSVGGRRDGTDGRPSPFIPRLSTAGARRNTWAKNARYQEEQTPANQMNNVPIPEPVGAQNIQIRVQGRDDHCRPTNRADRRVSRGGRDQRLSPYVTARPESERPYPCRIFATAGADPDNCHVTPDLPVLRSPGRHLLCGAGVEFSCAWPPACTWPALAAPVRLALRSAEARRLRCPRQRQGGGWRPPRWRCPRGSHPRGPCPSAASGTGRTGSHTARRRRGCG